MNNLDLGRERRLQSRELRLQQRELRLQREQRLSTLDAELDHLLTDNPDMAERLHAAAAGDLPIPDLEDDSPMAPNDASVLIRLPQELLARAEGLVSHVQGTEVGALGKVKRATVLRLAIMRGLTDLEADAAKVELDAAKPQRQALEGEYTKKPTRRRRRRKRQVAGGK